MELNYQWRFDIIQPTNVDIVYLNLIRDVFEWDGGIGQRGQYLRSEVFTTDEDNPWVEIQPMELLPTNRPTISGYQKWSLHEVDRKLEEFEKAFRVALEDERYRGGGRRMMGGETTMGDVYCGATCEISDYTSEDLICMKQPGHEGPHWDLSYLPCPECFGIELHDKGCSEISDEEYGMRRITIWFNNEGQYWTRDWQEG